MECFGELRRQYNQNSEKTQRSGCALHFKLGFFRRRKFKKVTIPNTIDSIGGFAFDNCKSLKKVNLPRALKSIEHLLGKKAYFGSSCFSRCTSLEEIVIPENVLVLPEYIFLDCLSLKKVTLPSSLMIIENNAFSYCSALETVYFHGTLREFRNIELGQGNDYLLDAKIIFIP